MNKFPIEKCPHCGNDEIYIIARISGTLSYNYKLDGSNDAYNGEMYEATKLTRISKYAYCNNCNKRLFKITDDMDI